MMWSGPVRAILLSGLFFGVALPLVPTAAADGILCVRLRGTSNVGTGNDLGSGACEVWSCSITVLSGGYDQSWCKTLVVVADSAEIVARAAYRPLGTGSYNPGLTINILVSPDSTFGDANDEPWAACSWTALDLASGAECRRPTAPLEPGWYQFASSFTPGTSSGELELILGDST